MKFWRTTKDACNYQATFKKGKLEIWMDESNKESAGGKLYTAGAIIRRDSRRKFIQDIFGDEIYQEILAEVEALQTKFEAQNPQTYSNKQHM